MTRIGLILLFLQSSCTMMPAGEPELLISGRPTEINDFGEVTTLSITATDGLGKVGKGQVTVTGAIGEFENGVTLDLDEFGKAMTRFSCKVLENPACKGTQTFKAEWKVDGKTATATARIRVYPPPLPPWELGIEWDSAARTASCRNDMQTPMTPCVNGMCPRGFSCFAGNCVLNGGGGSLQYTLRFGQSVDLDLHLVEPMMADGGVCEVFYAATNRSNNPSTCGAVSSLDLDSNAGCNIDNVNIENIIVPVTRLRPVPGVYIARVDLFESCGASMPITWELEVRAGAAKRFYCGQFSPSQADRGGAMSGITVSRIVIP
jgi:hypothetical protein